ncbi:MAG: retropepsin-like domain-containing protein [Acidobacteriaceae bacterium]|nr:retropepsin-like domain-containing protein [Acidobacteriaceae bacterium]
MSAPTAPALYRGAVAAAFNNVADAEAILKPVIDKGSDAESDDANKWLEYLYVRTGQYAKAAALADDGTATGRMLRTLPNQCVNDFGAATLSCKIDGRKLFVPASLAGKPVEFFIDSDANFSFMSESEARDLGLAPRDCPMAVHGATGNATGIRIAVAPQLTIGTAELSNVTFLVLPDSSEVFRNTSLTRQGALGIPVLLALRAIRFSRRGTFEIGSATAAAGANPNLCFDGSDPVARVDFTRRGLPVILDTGAHDTEIWPSFAAEFPDSMRSGKNGSKLENSVGGRSQVPERVIPELTLCVGGFDTRVHPAHVLLAQTVPNSKWYYGRLGLDVLTEAEQVTIDFASLRLTLQ